LLGECVLLGWQVGFLAGWDFVFSPRQQPTTTHHNLSQQRAFTRWFRSTTHGPTTMWKTMSPQVSETRLSAEIDLVKFVKEDSNLVEDPVRFVQHVHELLRRMDDQSAKKATELGHKLHAVDAVASSDTPQAKLDNLTAWLASLGSAPDDRCWQFRASPTDSHVRGCGAFATEDLPEGKPIMRVRREAIFSAKFGKALCPEVAAFVETYADNPTLELAMLMLYHRFKPDSFFRPYIDALPTVFSVPLFWDPAIFAALRHSRTMIRSAFNLRASVILYIRARQMAKKMECKAFPASYLTWTNFRWALSVVITRQNKIPLPAEDIERMGPADDHCVLALVPGWDMLNHAVGTTTTTFDSSLDALLYTTMRPSAQGEEILMFYGPRPNDLLLIYAGFCVPGNPHESLDADVPLPADDIARVRDCFVKSVGCEQVVLPPTTAADGAVAPGYRAGNVMFTVNRSDGGKLQDAAVFGAVAAVMTREEAVAVMRLRAKTCDELFAGLNAAAATPSSSSSSSAAASAAAEGTVGEEEEEEEGDARPAPLLPGDDLRRRAMAHLRAALSTQRAALQTTLDALTRPAEGVDGADGADGATAAAPAAEPAPAPASATTPVRAVPSASKAAPPGHSNGSGKKKGKGQRATAKGTDDDDDDDDGDDAILEEALAAAARLRLEQEAGSGAAVHHPAGLLPEPFRQGILAHCGILLQVRVCFHSARYFLHDGGFLRHAPRCCPVPLAGPNRAHRRLLQAHGHGDDVCVPTSHQRPGQRGSAGG